MKAVQFPDGDVLTLAPGMTFTISSVTLTVAYLGTTLKTFACRTAAGADGLRAQLLAAPDQDVATKLTDPSALWITGISPAVFNPCTDTITITGNNLSVGGAGNLYLDDAGGGTDYNGLYMTCTVVDDNTLTAVFGNVGDGSPIPGSSPPGSAGSSAGNLLLTYKDGAGAKSNILLASINTTCIVTMT